MNDNEGLRETMELLLAARDGDRDSLAQLVARYRPRLLERVRHLLGPGVRRWAESVDFTQTVLVDFLAELDSLAIDSVAIDSEKALLRWLTAVARNAIRDEARRKHTHGLDTCAGGEPIEPVADPEGRRQVTPPSEVIGREETERIRAMLERLPEDARQVVALRQLEGLSFAEVGRRLARSENAVQLLHARALRRLGELLGDGQPSS